MMYTEYQIQQMVDMILQDETFKKETEGLWGIGLMRYLELIGPDEYPEQLLTTRAAVRQALLNEIHRRNALDDISHNVERRHAW